MSTALEVTYLPTTSLKPHPKNPRVHTDKQVGQIAQSIEAFGFNVPILVDDRQNIVAGHGRLLAARKLGWNTVPIIKLNPSRSVHTGWRCFRDVASGLLATWIPAQRGLTADIVALLRQD